MPDGPQRVSRDVEYVADGTRMVGYLCTPSGAVASPGVLLVHDAFGLSPDVMDLAHRLAWLGLPVFAADVWGDRDVLTSQEQIGPRIGAMAGDRRGWMVRVAAAHRAAGLQPEIDGAAVVMLGYCFGGSSALEYIRTGGGVRGVVAVHPGLDLLDPGWSAANVAARVLVCTGADDPMATPAMRTALEASMTGAGIDWETDLYSGTKHAFTSPASQYSPTPEAVAYHPRNAARAWESTTRFLRELLPDAPPSAVARRTPTNPAAS